MIWFKVWAENTLCFLHREEQALLSTIWVEEGTEMEVEVQKSPIQLFKRFAKMVNYKTTKYIQNNFRNQV